MSATDGMSAIDRALLIGWTVIGDGCWIWNGTKNARQYGQIRAGAERTDKVMLQVHRVVYEASVGAIPNDLTLDHLCRNPPCVNPDHLEPVTIGENVRRGENVNRMKTHCPKGHEYAAVSNKRGRRRICPICRRDQQRARRARRMLECPSSERSS